MDGSGNVYIADTINGAVKEWNASTQTLSTPVSGLSTPWDVATDHAGNVYILDSGGIYGTDGMILEYNASTHAVSTLVPATSTLDAASGIAADAAGNVYVAAIGGVYQWNASSQDAAS